MLNSKNVGTHALFSYRAYYDVTDFLSSLIKE